MRNKKLFAIIIFFFVTLLNGCVNLPDQNLDEAINVDPNNNQISTIYQHNFPWWNDTVFYEIFVRSFYDSDNDGIGDIKGLISKLDYLNDGNPETKDDLGITGIWLMPIFPSTSYHGYDVIDYRNINPELGTMEDFKLFLDEAHKRGIKVIIDFVINHTSVQHPWFIESRGDKESAFRDWYIWSDTDLEYPGPWGQDVWHFNFDNTYYYGVFWSGMPDLNYTNPNVTNEIFEITDFWLSDVGVDGFRIDGALHLIEDGEVQKNTEATHLWFREFYKHYKNLNPQAMTVGEVWDSNFSAVKYVKDDEFDLVFDFEQSESIMQGVMGSDGQRVLNALAFNYNLYPILQKANFLTNHDMNRVMHVFQGNEDKAKAAAVILLTAPGVPFIYYGEEIGMLGSKPDEDIRLPMQWSPDQFAGFSEASPWRTINSNYPEWNVETLANRKGSILNLYRSLIHARSINPALRVGEFQTLNTNERNVIAYARILEEQIVIVIINLETESKDVSLDIPPGMLAIGDYPITSLLDQSSYGSLKVIDEMKTTFQLENSLDAWEYLILVITP